MNERRKHKRSEIDLLVNYCESAKVLSKNISEDGMCIIADNPLNQGTIINLRFCLFKKEEISVYGKVIWNRKTDEGLYENGISFWNISNKGREIIRKYVKEKPGLEK